KSSRLVFAGFDERFLEKSWEWLRDPELKSLTMTPDFTREEQREWFSTLPGRTDYLIWGLSCEGTAIGAAGVKNITKASAEYWGYIAERQFWGTGLGREMMSFVIGHARKLGLGELHLKVHQENVRAIQLYSKVGFTAVGQEGEVTKMRMA